MEVSAKATIVAAWGSSWRQLFTSRSSNTVASASIVVASWLSSTRRMEISVTAWVPRRSCSVSRPVNTNALSTRLISAR